MPALSVQERFESKYKIVDTGYLTPCWLWTDKPTSKGYGTLGVEGRTKGAHRLSWELYVGPIPEGLQIDHLCRVRLCVNWTHLEPVTRRVNLLRGVGFPGENVRKTNCPAGHTYTPENTYTSAKGKRNCQACHLDATRAWRAKQKV